MNLERIDFHIRGVAPLIVHNALLSDPLYVWSRAVAQISKKRKKTEAELIEMARCEFQGSLYHDGERPFIPGANLERMFRDAAAKTKKGKDVQAGMIVPEDAPLIYDGPKDRDKLWAKEQFRFRASAGVGGKRVMRTRPIFREWELKFFVLISLDVLEVQQVCDFLDLAGRVIGLCDWRPKYGRFEVVEG